mmetsp:Transcript_11456/g.22098  ORF Transcript_11456/g.22098 Transcript_11456/m.22098 type:complete len:324 (+) Transcript_11456:70-1041(+)|eukprot:CAMPEP_0172718120 /NCGR_PEP_ID=MMETSP1074-20121228/73456_1 /TAXON_ID=2916 /ORGANISM="Ceratium fusus, Strain PA161109" /LENGTH=323 /DNA_ID=CAMNT_0013543211 /DNA_START=63 /DNA_END=1034 /DNA_ORIENTATION=+
MATSLHGDVASAIGQQVEQMILQARKDSETRVKHDLTEVRARLQQMEGLIGSLTDRVSRVRTRAQKPGPDPEHVDQAFLNNSIHQLEQKWGSEVKALKQDLHRTILAHNHNSDLMRHHRDALDEARRRLDAQTQPKAEQVDAQIEKVDRMLRAGQAKQRALEALTERMTALEQQVGDLVPPFGGGMLPGVPRGLNAMGIPNPAMVQQREQPKRPGKKEGELPTEEEVRARLLQAAQAGHTNGNDGGASSFNAEAPVFVPRGAPQAVERSSAPVPATVTPAAMEASEAAALDEPEDSGGVEAAVMEDVADAEPAAGEPEDEEEQ